MFQYKDGISRYWISLTFLMWIPMLVRHLYIETPPPPPPPPPPYTPPLSFALISYAKVIGSHNNQRCYPYHTQIRKYFTQVYAIFFICRLRFRDSDHLTNQCLASNLPLYLRILTIFRVRVFAAAIRFAWRHAPNSSLDGVERPNSD